MLVTKAAAVIIPATNVAGLIAVPIITAIVISSFRGAGSSRRFCAVPIRDFVLLENALCFILICILLGKFIEEGDILYFLQVEFLTEVVVVDQTVDERGDHLGVSDFRNHDANF